MIQTKHIYAIASLFCALMMTGACVAPVANMNAREAATTRCMSPDATEGLADDEAEPVRAPDSSLAAALDEGGPADTITTNRTLAAVSNMARCWNQGETASLVSLWMPGLLQNEFGIPDREIAMFALANLPPLAIDELGNVQAYGEGVVSVDVVYRREVGQHMLLYERWFLREQDGWLLLDSLSPLPIAVAGPTIEIDVRITEHAIELEQANFPAGHTLIFHVANDGAQPHEFVVFRPPQAVSVEDVVAAGELPLGSAITGATFALPGEQATELVLVDLEPGAYIVICNFEMGDGETHVGQGEVALFTVQAAE
jgi:uncharacterized cupredoxin-like copper-binding protein